MQKYTTGDIAKLCGVSVRTVQYYDTRGILSPSELSEGGRRLYTEDDLHRMRAVCFLREIGLPINSISSLLEDEKPEEIIMRLLDEQESLLRSEIEERQSKADMLTGLKKSLRGTDGFSLDSLNMISRLLKSKKKTDRLHIFMVLCGLPSFIIQVITVLIWLIYGIYWPFFAIYIPFGIICGSFISVYYFKRVSYICPNCHQLFRGSFRETFFASHTPNTRKLTCPCCGKVSFCFEICGGDETHKEINSLES